MSDQKKLPIIISPKCVAGYAWLNKKDEMSDKYTITGLLPKKAKEIPEGRVNYGKEVVPGAKWLKDLLALFESVGAPHKIGEDGCHIKDGDVKYANAKDKEKAEQFKGMLLLNVKSDFPPKLTDTKGNVLPKDETIWAGDTVKIAIQPKHHVVNGKNFLSLYISQVMLIEKGERKGGIDMGEEDGYVSDANPLDFGTESAGDDNEDF